MPDFPQKLKKEFHVVLLHLHKSMNLYKQQPYWLMKNGIMASYPSLKKNLKQDRDISLHLQYP